MNVPQLILDNQQVFKFIENGVKSLLDKDKDVTTGDKEKSNASESENSADDSTSSLA